MIEDSCLHVYRLHCLVVLKGERTMGMVQYQIRGESKITSYAACEIIRHFPLREYLAELSSEWTNPLILTTKCEGKV